MRSIFFILFLFNFLNSFSQNDYCSKGKIINAGLNKTDANDNLAKLYLNKYDLLSYDIKIFLPLSQSSFNADVSSFSKCLVSNLDTFLFQLDANYVTIDSVFINNAYTSYFQSGINVLIPLTSSILQNQQIKLRVKYHGNYINNNGYWSYGLSKGSLLFSSSDTTIASFSAAYSLNKWLPAKEVLTDKVDSMKFAITTENTSVANANGKLTHIDSSSTYKTYYWTSNYPTDYYLIAVSVGKFSIYNAIVKPINLLNDSIKITNYFIPNTSVNSAYDTIFYYQNEYMKYFSELLVPYPFYKEKYGISYERLGGGMENQTMTHIGVLDLMVTGHELFHQWFGDYVTCKSYADISINEGFASYAEYLLQEKFYPSNALNYMKAVQANATSTSYGSVYCTDTANESRLYDYNLTYQKGSAVIHTLRFLLGDSLFFLGLKNFLAAHTFGNASFDDLKNTMETTSGLNLQDYFTQWIYGQGYPIISSRRYWNNNNFIFKLSQTTSAPSSISFFKTPIQVMMITSNNDTVIQKVNWQTQNQIFTISNIDSVVKFFVDPNCYILKKSSTNYIDPTLEIKNVFLDNSLKVYPNPSFGEFSILYGEVFDKIELYNILGQKVAEEKFDLIKIKNFKFKNIEHGSYILKIVNEKMMWERSTKINFK